MPTPRLLLNTTAVLLGTWISGVSWQLDLKIEDLGNKSLERQILGNGEKVWVDEIRKKSWRKGRPRPEGEAVWSLRHSWPPFLWMWKEGPPGPTLCCVLHREHCLPLSNERRGWPLPRSAGGTSVERQGCLLRWLWMLYYLVQSPGRACCALEFCRNRNARIYHHVYNMLSALAFLLMFRFSLAHPPNTPASGRWKLGALHMALGYWWQL